MKLMFSVTSSLRVSISVTALYRTLLVALEGNGGVFILNNVQYFWGCLREKNGQCLSH
jgi:hypothetical protein